MADAYRGAMGRAEAHRMYEYYGDGYAIVRWTTRYGRPRWTIEVNDFAERQLLEYGPEEVRIDRR